MVVCAAVLTVRLAGTKTTELLVGRPVAVNTTVPPATVAGPRETGMLIAWPGATGGSAALEAGATVKFGATTVCVTMGEVLVAKFALAV